MRRVIAMYGSSIGKKVVMAVTGLMLFGFMAAHTAGNLKMFFGPDKIDEYAHFLRDVGHEVFGYSGLLWGFRVGLFVAFVLHVVSAAQLTRMSRAARPIAYQKHEAIETTYAARTMRWGGVILFLFIIFHLLDSTFGTFNPNYEHLAVYQNSLASFSVWWITSIYVVAMILLGFHLYHGVWSMLQTLGINHPKYNHWRRSLAALSAFAIAVPNIVIPLAVLFGILS